MYVIKCRDIAETAPEGFPSWLLTEKWERFVIEYSTLDKAIDAVIRQVQKPKPRPVPEREYRIFEKDGRKLKLVWSLENRK